MQMRVEEEVWRKKGDEWRVWLQGYGWTKRSCCELQF